MTRIIKLFPVLVDLTAVLFISATTTGCSLSKKKTDIQTTRDTTESYDPYATDPYTASTYTPRAYESPSRGTGFQDTPDVNASDRGYGSEPAYADDSYQSGARYHVVAKSDTLYKLARTYYSDQAKWRDIYDANRASIDDPNFIRIGQRLLIP